MKALSLASFALALSAVLLALFLVPRSSAPERVPALAATAPDAAALRGELASLTDTIAALEERLDRIEMRQTTLADTRVAAVPLEREPVAVEPDETVVATLEDLAASLRNPALPPSTGFETLVRDVMDRREDEERAQREERRRQAMEERLNERVEELTEVLGLSRSQAGDVRGILLDTTVRREDLFSSMRAGGDFDRDTMRDGMRAIREASRTSLAGVLAPDQYERYVELEDADERRFRGGWGGPDAPRSPGPAGRDRRGRGD